MSDALAVAMWRARVSKNIPQVINVVDLNEDKLKEAHAKIAELQEINTKLIGKIGSLTTELNRRQKFPAETPAPFLKISQVTELVSTEFRMAVLDMQSERRTRDATEARMVAMYLARKLTNRSYPTIAKFFGGRDHTTAMNAFNVIEARRKENTVLDARIGRLEQSLLGSPVPSLEPSAPAAPIPAVGAILSGDA